MTEITLFYREILKGGGAAHITRAQVAPTRPKALHSQDFFELFWVQNGHVRHHLPSGIETLSEGGLVFMRAGDTHALQGRGSDALVVSLTLHPSLMDALGKRHAIIQGKFFWADAPVTLQLDTKALIRLNQTAMTLENSALDRFSVEAFLLPLFSELLTPDTPVDAPEWLLRAMAAASDPAVFREGAAGFVAQTGQTHAHVSRTMKRVTGISPSDFINEKRMIYAVRQLTGTSETLQDIAADCGLPNLSHFHKLFRSTYKLTPHAYRRKFQRHVVQPE
jgi:AraC family transcriptional regulator, dual regulator of chb operon